MESKLNYIRFPIYFIRDMLVDKDVGIRKMLLFGYCMAADRLDVDEYNAYRQTVYCYYQYVKAPDSMRAIIPTFIKEEIEVLIGNGLFDYDPDHYGFGCDGVLDVEHEISQLMEYGRKEPKFHKMVLEYHRIRSTAELFGISVTDIDSVIAQYRKYSEESTKHTRWVSIKIGLLFEYMNQPKTEYQVMLLAAYMGVKAIIGNESYKRTTYPYIMANMFGCIDDDERQRILAQPENSKLKELYDKYTTRKVFGRINKDLQKDGFVREWLPHGKSGTFVSTKLSHKMFLREVAKELDGRKKSSTKHEVSVEEYRKASVMELNEIRNNATG